MKAVIFPTSGTLEVLQLDASNIAILERQRQQP
jgi:hypothetical protein